MRYNDLEIRMLPINPRYTNMEEINFEDLHFPEYSDITVARELLKYEGDFSDLLDLVISIKNNGFLYINDKILIHLDKNKKIYYTLEGNRRLLVIKLINKEFKFNDVCGKIPFYDNTKIIDWEKNKNDIINEINNMDNIPLSDNFFSDVTFEKKEVIWKTIYSKHIGEQIGKRDWSRAKYFDDLLKMFKYVRKSKNIENSVADLSILFGKKVGIIKQDIRSAIWIIRSLEIYNKFNKNFPIDFKQMEVSGYELLLSQKVIIDGREKTMRDLLDIEINIDNLSFSYSKNINETGMEKIINFLVINAKEKNITTREIKEEIYDELSDTIGYSLSNKRTLNFTYNFLRKKEKNNELDAIENAQYKLLTNLKSEDINPNEFTDYPYDSKFVKSIKYMMRNDLKTLSNLKNFNENEYPFTNVALTIRTIIDLLILEFFYRVSSSVDSFIDELKCPSKVVDEIKNFISIYNDSKEHDVGKITGILSSLISKGSSNLTEFIIKLIKSNYGERLKELKINIDDSYFIILELVDYKKIIESKDNNFALLNNLVHKPYCGFEMIDNVNMIDNLNKMYNTVKESLKIFKIWEPK